MSNDFADAIAAATAEVSPAAETTVETTPEVKPEVVESEAKPEVKPEAKPAVDSKVDPKVDEEEFYNPTAEELAAIEASPQLQKAYKALRRGFTTKTTEIAKMRKDLQERAALADWVQQNPEKAARALAEHAGLTIAEARAEVKAHAAATTAAVDELEAEWATAVGKDAAAILRPLIEKTVNKRLTSEIEPVRAETEALTKAAQARGIQASIREFGASITERGDDWSQEIQEEMAKESVKVRPADDTPIGEYLDALYNVVQSRRTRLASTRERVTRLKRTRDDQEPVTTGRSAAPAEETITTDMNDNDSVALAVKMARRDAGLR